ncbi:MAG: SAM-dependent methyltransferase [Methylotenera sp.]
MNSLPIPSLELQVQSQQLANLIQQKIKQAGGWVDFATFMHMALYTPGLGYYSGGARKFGMGGDFVTAPEISPLFAKTLALQAAQILARSHGDDFTSNILELGAGTGKLAADLLLELQQLNPLPKQYFILEVSDYLRQIQRETLHKKLPPELFNRVVWLETLPQDFTGLIIGNEVLDAIPVHLVRHTSQGLLERGVTFDKEFVWQDKRLEAGSLCDLVSAYSLPNDYLTEVCPMAIALINSLSNMLKKGVILMLDYGFSAREYYHPQRDQGTLMCHYQHYAHSDPLINVGLQDITAHVNFTAIAEAAVGHGLQLSGYCTQAQFLMNCGMLNILAKVSPSDMAAYAPLAAAAQKLLSPAEMGELFKVIALSRGVEIELLGFKSGDKAHTL